MIFGIPPISCGDRSPATTVTITTVGLGNREVVAASVDVPFIEIRFTADAVSDLLLHQVTVTDVLNTADRQNSPFTQQILQNMELWADLTPADSWRKDRFETKVSDTTQYSDTFMRMTARFTFSLNQELRVPAGTTVSMLVVGDVPAITIPGASHFVKPGYSPNFDCAAATTTDGSKARVCWDIDPDWPKMNTVTIVAPSMANP
jgi:hypothetical protein